MTPDPITCDTIIFGGGAAGLWLLDELVRRGHSVLLLESDDLGAGQTIASQGIIHGGLKYTLSGLLTAPARELALMPDRWRRCLGGEAEPDLRNTRLRSNFCFMWRSQRLSSRLSMIGARIGMQTPSTKVDDDGRPSPLAGCPGRVVRVEEQVIEPASFIADLGDRNRAFLLKIDAAAGLEFGTDGPGVVSAIRLIDPEAGMGVELRPRQVVLTAGAGNSLLMGAIGLEAPVQQRRPLHMVMARGERLPELNGHNVDGAATRVTITSTRDCHDRVVWQIGGQIAEDGVSMNALELIEHARSELLDVLPGIDLSVVEFATYRVDRAEVATGSGRRPDRAYATSHGNTIIGWPTKLALVPQLSDQIIDLLERPTDGAAPFMNDTPLATWPRPAIAMPPWETEMSWTAAL